MNEVGKMLVNNGYKIKVLNTINFAKSMHYNPFAYIHSEEDILNLVNTIIANTKGDGEKGGEDFWVKAERLLYTAYIGFIYYEMPESEHNFDTLVKLINKSETREDDETYQNEVDRMFEALEYGEPDIETDKDGNKLYEPLTDKNGKTVYEKDTDENGEKKPVMVEKIKRDKNGNIVYLYPPQPDHFAVRQYKRYKLAAGKTAKSILISCGARLAPFDIAALRDIMAYDEMKLNEIGEYDENGKKTALFIIVSDTTPTYNFVVAILYSQLFNILCTVADDKYGGRLPVHVRCLLDEFANIGQIPNFSQTPNDVLGGDVLTKIESVTNVAIIPFASVILTYVVCYDLITTCINGNNFREFDTSIFFKFAIKGGIATYLLGKSTTIALAFFDVASEATTKASKQIVISQTPVTNIDMLKFNEELLESNLGELVGLLL